MYKRNFLQRVKSRFFDADFMYSNQAADALGGALACAILSAMAICFLLVWGSGEGLVQAVAVALK